MLKRIISASLAAVLFLFALNCANEAVLSGSRPTSVSDVSNWAGHAVKRQLKSFERLNQLAPTIMLSAGAQEQDGIFAAPDCLLENIADPDPETLEKNLSGVEAFLSNHNIAAAFLLVPTACAIKQQEIPARARLFNQKELISRCYDRFAGKAATIDAYSKLFAAQDQYTYYRTETAVTGLGGYYIYTALSPKLGFAVRPISQFEVQNLALDYYGELYRRSSYKGVAPDMLTLYRFSRFSRQYQLSRTDNGEKKNYYTLFPTHLIELNEPKSAILGGFGERMDISVVSPYEESLLIFADETALSFLPFLVVHYGNITVIDLSKYPAEQIGQINMDNYDQVLFAYSVDDFIHSDMCSAAALV